MKTVNAAVKNAIRSGFDVTAIPRLTVEWNHNRMASVVQVDNYPSDQTNGYDIEQFPVESLVKSNRPTAGIMKARVGEARISDPYMKFDGINRMSRYYIGSVDDTYKYWTSPGLSNGVGAFPNGDVNPYVLYPNLVQANKIVIGFEDTWTQPTSFTVQIRLADNSTWSVVATNPLINSKGQVILYYNGTGWSSTKPAVLSNLKQISGVQVNISAINQPNSYASVIEVSARQIADLSDRLVNVSDTFDMGEKSYIYPLGTVTSNTASVELFNGDGIFNQESPDSPYRGLLEPNAEFNLEYVYSLNNQQYAVQQFKMYGGPWKGQREDSVSIELADFSKYFQEIKPRKTMYQNLTVSEIVWRVCDSIGFVDYQIHYDDLVTDHKIPIWWADGEQTVWEIFDELSKASQTAIYFDGYGKLQVRTRKAAFDTANAPVWTLRGENYLTELADIVELNQTDELEANSITVNYQTTEFNKIVDGQSVNQILWQPEDTLALRATPLLNRIEANTMGFALPPGEAKLWPYEGMVNIQGELIRYKGKQYAYYEGGVRKYVDVESQEEMEALNLKSPTDLRYLNGFTGNFKATERGVWNSEPRIHDVEATGYSVRKVVDGNLSYNAAGWRHDKASSRIYLASSGFKNNTDILLGTRGSVSDTGFYTYGTKFRFEVDSSRANQTAGIMINNDAGTDGYYIELSPTTKVLEAKNRAKRHELIFFTRNGGSNTRIGPNDGKGVTLAIVEGIEYEIDVHFTPGATHKVSIWVNGVKSMDVEVPTAKRNGPNGKFGVFLRGNTSASFEYLYAIAQDEGEPSDDFSFLDKVDSGYTGGQADREFVYGWTTQRRKVKKKWVKESVKKSGRFFDEFGPIVHEIREFDVKFDPAPALTNRIYMGNDYSVVCPEYKGNAFGATFYVANCSRQTAILNGEDNLTYAGGSTPVNPIIAVIGRAVVLSEAESVKVTNDLQIRRRGVIDAEISNQWIQSKAMAQDIADWISGHWSEGADEQEVTIFGNPLLEIGDLVAIDYPLMDMTVATHKYFIVGINNQFDSGLETTVTLRRMV